MLGRKWWIVVCTTVLFISGVFLIGDRVSASLDLFLGQFHKTKIEVNGQMMGEDEVPPFIANGQTVIPLTQAAEILNAYTEWDSTRRVAKLIKPTVNMTIVKRSSNTTIQINPTFRAGSTQTFRVATQVSGVPISDHLNMRFTVQYQDGQIVYTGPSFTIDTQQYNGSFVGDLNVSNLQLSRKGKYTLQLQMEDPNKQVRYITIGEYVMIVH